MPEKNTRSTQRQAKFFVVALSRGFSRFDVLLQTREQTVVSGPHVTRVRRQSSDKVLRILKTHPSRDEGPGLLRLRHGVRLQPVGEGQPGRERAQKRRPGRQLAALLLRDERTTPEPPENHQ